MKTPFEPAYGLSNRHLQTIIPALFRKRLKPAVDIECFELDDGDFVDCYWHHQPAENSTQAIVVLFHGLEGSFHSPYIQGMMSRLQQAGFSVVLMHFRGCSGKMNRLPRSYHSGDTADAKAWLETVRQRFPRSPLFALGFSLGGNMLLKLLAEWGRLSVVHAAVSVCAPLQLDICARKMNQGFARLYQYRLLRELKQSLLRKYRLFDMQALIGINERQVNRLNSFWAFDDVYTGPIHGFSSAEDYYLQSSAKQYLAQIDTSTLIIQALDDPFMLPALLPDVRQLPANVQLEVSRKGGHLGFMSGSIIKPHYWLEDRIIDYLNTFI